MAKPRILLKARKAITGKRATPKELGYERDSRGRLTKPGTRAFNEKVQFTKLDRKLFLSEYNRRIKTAKDNADVGIYEQKKIDRKKQYDRKISDLERQREHDLKVAEKNRKNSLKKRQLNDWIKKVDAVLIASRKGTVKEIMNKNFKLIFSQEIDIINKKAVFSKAEAKRAYEYIYQSHVSEFNSLFHKRFNPTALERMSASSIINFLSEISSMAKYNKASEYNKFRRKFLK